jgi:hypothetical protein
MSIAEKLTTVAENVPKVYEAGQQAERERFWGGFQNYGEPQNYYYGCSYGKFKDAYYDPIYDFVATSGNAFQNMFYNNKYITDTKVGFDARKTTSIGAMFYDASKIKTIRKLIVGSNVNSGGNNAFYGCTSLENITMQGTIVQSMNFGWSPLLSEASIDSIISCLKNLTGSTALTLTVHETVYNKMVANGKDALVTAKNWALAKA